MTNEIHRLLLLLLAAATTAVCAQPVAAAPQDIVIIISNGDYLGSVPKAEFAERDGEAVYRMAREVLRVPVDRINHLKNLTGVPFQDLFGKDGAVGPNLEPIRARLAPDSNIYFFYSGHGMPAKRSGSGEAEAVLLPTDGTPTNAERHGIPVRSVRRALAELQRTKAPDGRVFIFLDACFTGSSGGGTLSTEARPVRLGTRGASGAEPRIIEMAASGPDQESLWDRERRYGIFTDAVVEGLYGSADADRNGEITAQELDAYITRHVGDRVARLWPSPRRYQTPTLAGDPAVRVASIASTTPPRDPKLAAHIMTKCQLLPVSNDINEIKSFLPTCGLNCPCREDLERRLTDLTNAEARCTAETEAIESLAKRGDDVRAQIERLATGASCNAVKKRAAELIEAFTAQDVAAARKAEEDAKARAAEEIAKKAAADAAARSAAEATAAAVAAAEKARADARAAAEREARELADYCRQLEDNLEKWIAHTDVEQAKVAVRAYASEERCFLVRDKARSYLSSQDARDAEKKRAEADAYCRTLLDQLKGWLAHRDAEKAAEAIALYAAVDRCPLVQSEAHKYLGRRAKVTADAAPTTPECQSQLENLKGWARQPVGAASTSAIEKYAAFVTCPAVAAEAKRLLAARRGSPAVSLYGDSNVVRYCEQLKSYVAARAKERDIEGLRHVAGRDSCPEAKREAIAALAVLGVTIGPAKPGTVATAGDPALAVAPGSGQSFRDRLKGGGECQHCPDMVVIPSGSFTIGSPLAETDSLQNEGPQKRITFSQPFAVGRAEVTRGQFRAYVERSGAQPGTGCRSWDGREWRHDDRRSWMSAGFTQDDSHPVVCVSWDDIVGYVQWLSRETGYTYQLLSEAEWEYAARAGTGTMYYFDAGSDQLCRYGNTADAEAKKAFPDWMVAHCSDGFLHTAPTGRYQPNRWGLYDMIGNAAEWLDDCFNDSYRNVPLDGGSMTSGDCGARMHRGGSWRSDPGGARVAFRGYNISRERYDSIGFRVTRVMPR